MAINDGIVIWKDRVEDTILIVMTVLKSQAVNKRCKKFLRKKAVFLLKTIDDRLFKQKKSNVKAFLDFFVYNGSI